MAGDAAESRSLALLEGLETTGVTRLVTRL